MIKQLLFGIKSIKGPIFYKDFSEYNKQLEDLIELSSRVKSNKRLNIDRDIMYIKQGISGEKNVKYELENSFIPMIILHDIRIKEGDYVAQMDYIIITHYFIMILETKKLSGDIIINEIGEFIRVIKNKKGQIIKREGIYSPFSQNERHIRILEKILKDKKVIKNIPILSCVVMANEKNIINRDKAPERISENIIKYDQLTDFIKRKIDEKKKEKAGEILEGKMYKIADFLRKNNNPLSINYKRKYCLNREDIIEVQNDLLRDMIPNDDKYSIKNAKLILKELKEYRYERAKSENIPQYIIFTNLMLDEIIETLPRDIKSILKIRGFGKVRTEKYGQDILNIINRNII